MPANNALGKDDRPAVARLATSDHIAAIMDEVDGDSVSVAWLVKELGERSFGLTLLLLGVLALVPGFSTVVGVVIVWPATQLILRHHVPVLPDRFSRRTITVARLRKIVRFALPRLRWLERLVRPRLPAVVDATHRVTGFVMLLLGPTLISPFPFSHVVPALVIILLALAYLEEDGTVLIGALVAALASAAITAAQLWGVIATANWLGGS